MDSNTKVTSDGVPTFLIGGWTFNPQIFYLERGQEVVKLEPRAAHLLSYLAFNPGTVISRERLMEEVWSGVVVGDEALTNSINKLRKAFGDDSHQPRIIETIPKAGYRLIAKVECITSPDTAAEKPLLTIRKQGNKNRLLQLVTVLVVIMALIAITYNWQKSVVKDDTAEDRPIALVDISNVPSLAVLPFENLSQDIQQEYFVDGISEDVITDLSRISNLQVLGRTTTFRYKGQTIDPQQLGKDLKVSHILEGSVRKSGRSLRITARLIDTTQGLQIWVERYDRQVGDIFKVQDDVTQNIIKSLSVKLTSRDSELLGHANVNNFEAYDLFLQGRWRMNERTRDANRQAQNLYRQSINLDPGYSRPYGALAVAIIRTVTSGWSASPMEDRSRALELALRATMLNSKSQNAYWALAFIHLYRKEHIQAIEAAKQAMINAPSFADGLALMAFINNYLGNAEAAISQINRAMQLNPLYAYEYLANLGWGYYTLGRYDKAVELLQEALERNENANLPRLLLAASYMGQGNQEEAEWEVEMILNNHPDMSVSLIDREFPFAEGDKKNEHLDRLRQAGLPE